MANTRTAQAPYLDERETSGAVDFDTAWAAYRSDGGAEALLRAAGIVIDCGLPLSPDLGDDVARVTGEAIAIEDYADAAHAVRRWFAAMREPGARH